MHNDKNISQKLAYTLLILISVYFPFRLILEKIITREQFVVLYATITLLVVISFFLKYGIYKREIIFIALISSYFTRLMLQMLTENTSFFTIISFFQYAFPIFFVFIGMRISNGYRNKFEKRLFLFAFISVLFGLLNSSLGLFPEYIYSTDRTIVAGIVVNRVGSLMGPSLATGGLAGISLAMLFSSGLSKVTFKTWLLGVVLIASVLLTFSRGGLIFFLVILLFISKKYSAGRTIERKKEKLLSLYLMLIIFLIVVNLMPLFRHFNNSLILERFVFDLFSSEEAGNSHRVLLMKKAWDIIVENPFGGKGYGYLGATAVERGVVGSFTPENYYLKLLGETGVFNLLLFLGASIKTLVVGFKIKDSEKYPYIGLILGFLIWSLFLQTLEYDFFAIVFWYSIGSIYRLSITEKHRRCLT